MMLMTTYGSLERSGHDRKWRVNRETVRLKYTDIVWNHYIYQHCVDYQNNHPSKFRRNGPFHTGSIVYFYYLLG